MSANSYSYIGKKIRPWEIDRILDRKLVGGHVRYLVKWRRFSELNTWEIRESFVDPSIIAKFERERATAIQRSVRLSTSVSVPRNSTSKTTLRVSTEIVNPSGDNGNVSCPVPAVTSVSTTSQDVAFENVKTVMESELQCGICLDIYKKPCLTDCEHIFCEECLHKWRKNRFVTCPVCRAVLNKTPKKLTQLNDFLIKVNQLTKP